MSGRYEEPDQRPVEWPSGVGRPKTIQELIQDAIRTEFARSAQAEGFESFEEADDFEVDEGEDEFASPYEIVDLAPDAAMERVANGGPQPGETRDTGANQESVPPASQITPPASPPSTPLQTGSFPSSPSVE